MDGGSCRVLVISEFYLSEEMSTKWRAEASLLEVSCRLKPEDEGSR